MSVIEIKVTINSDGCKERTGKGANAISNIINGAETINVSIHPLFKMNQQGTEKNKKQSNCFESDHSFVGHTS